MLNKYNFVRMFKSEADIPEDRLKYAEAMYVEIYLKRKKKKKFYTIFTFNNNQ